MDTLSSDALRDAINRVLAEWIASEGPEFDKQYPALRYAHRDLPHAVEKAKYINLDSGNSGAFMVEKSTGNVFGIKGYGQTDRRKYYGNILHVDGAQLWRWKHAPPNCRFPIRPGILGPQARIGPNGQHVAGIATEGGQ